MNVLAFDYGKKRIGLAWCDTAIGVVLPYGVIENKESGEMNREIIDLIKKERIEKVVIGLPVGLDGKENENTKTVRAFVDTLTGNISVPIEFFDERFTSREADRVKGSGASRDEKAAMLILQQYLDRRI